VLSAAHHAQTSRWPDVCRLNGLAYTAPAPAPTTRFREVFQSVQGNFDGQGTRDREAPQGGSQHQENHQDDADDRDGEVSEVAEARRRNQALYAKGARAGPRAGGERGESRTSAAPPSGRNRSYESDCALGADEQSRTRGRIQRQR